MTDAADRLAKRLGFKVYEHGFIDSDDHSLTNRQVFLKLWNELLRLERENETLVKAVSDLYYAGVWKCDRPVDEIGLWTAVRDAAGFEHGKSPKTLTSSTGGEVR